MCHFLLALVPVSCQRHSVVMLVLLNLILDFRVSKLANNKKKRVALPLTVQCLDVTENPSLVSVTSSNISWWLSSVSVTGCCCDPYRIGPREKYFHCEKCNLCLAQDLRGNHKVIITLCTCFWPTHIILCLISQRVSSLLLFMTIFFNVSVCWKCFKTELPSVYGGNETYNAFIDGIARDVVF